MKISDNDPFKNPEISRPGTKEVQGKGAKRSDPSSASAGDKVNISGRAKEIQEMSRLISSFPEIRAERVEEIKNALASGKYHIQPEKIAEKMIRASLQNEAL